MKIAVEARPIQWSHGTGIGNYTYYLIQKLSELDRENTYTFLWPDDQPISALPFHREFTYYTLPKDDVREETEIPLWLEAEKADLFHLPQNGFRTPKLAGKTKIIVTIHDLIPYFVPEMVRTSFLKRFTDEMPFIVERADHITTVSETSKQDIIRVFGVRPEKITVIPSAPGPSMREYPKTLVHEQVLEKFNLSKPYILYVGGLNPRKNVAELIYAYSKIRRELPEERKLVIPGAPGKHLTRLQLLAEALNIEEDVVFPGFISVDDLPWLYNGAALFVYPSLYEGFGLPPIEAMACGVPVIVSNVSSLPEIVGEAALTVNPYDTLALAEAMFSVLTRPELAEDLRKKGHLHCQRYTWQRNALQMLEVYRKVVG